MISWGCGVGENPFRKWPEKRLHRFHAELERRMSRWRDFCSPHFERTPFSSICCTLCMQKIGMVELSSYQKSCWMYLQFRNFVKDNLKAKAVVKQLFDAPTKKSPKGWLYARRPIGGYSCHCRTLSCLMLRCWVVSDVRQWNKNHLQSCQYTETVKICERTIYVYMFMFMIIYIFYISKRNILYCIFMYIYMFTHTCFCHLNKSTF